MTARLTGRRSPGRAPAARRRAPSARRARVLVACRPRARSTVERRRADPVGEVVDDADRRVGEPELAGDDALGGDRHPDHVGVRGDQPDLGRGLEARARSSASRRRRRSARRRRRSLPGGQDPLAPARGRSPGAMWPRASSKVVSAELQGDEVVGADEAADRRAPPQRADRADREHPVAAGRRAASAGWPRGRSGGEGRRRRRAAVALQDARRSWPATAAGRRSRPGAGRVAAEDHRQASHGSDPKAGG